MYTLHSDDECISVLQSHVMSHTMLGFNYFKLYYYVDAHTYILTKSQALGL